MSTNDNTPEASVPELGIHPRPEVPQALSVEAEAVSDPILGLIAQWEAERAQADKEPSETQQFMVRMSAANIAEFAERKRTIRRTRIVLAVVAILTGLGVIVASVAGML